jgi:hypothetical protein
MFHLRMQPEPAGMRCGSPLAWRPLLACLLLNGLLLAPVGRAATTVPMEVQMPGTQPGEVSNLESPGRCDNCHQDPDTTPEVTIAHDWRGSMMSHAGRDPLFWATLAIAEQDFDGAGDLCIRCHTMSGWLAGHSTPTDGSALSEAEAAEGVGCDVCHTMVNPDNSEHPGVQNPPFIANDGGSPPEGYYGSAQLAISGDSAKLGPYEYGPGETQPKHQWASSQFHRSVDFCGACHDVSNPVVGDLAPNNGAQQPLVPGTFDGQLDTPSSPRDITHKAAFNNPPYKYGVVERTYSEYKAGLLSQILVSGYTSLPLDLQAGAIQAARNAALGAGTGGNYADGTPRYFSCQTCHMPPESTLGCNKNGVQVRNDMPGHDLTGGNYWIPQVMQYMDAEGTLLLGGNLDNAEIAGMNDGIVRAQNNLANAAALKVSGNTVRVVNLTGHKLISGYPEGRRMWLQIEWKDVAGEEIRTDGDYGPLLLDYDIDGDNLNDTVETLLNLHDPNTRIYEAHGAITQEWANKLIAVSAAYGAVPVAYDRVSGAVTHTVADVAALNPGEYRETFHFVLNNRVVRDTRIPPYGMDYDEALSRSVLPVPANQYGNPGPGGTYDYFDEFELTPPAGAITAEITLMYQPTSWEYIQFLALANNGSVGFLASEGANLLDAWLNTGMAEPYEMATASWLDSDADGLPDDVEKNFDGDPAYNPLTDTNPYDADTDDDGLSDYDEIHYDGNPLYSSTSDTNPLSADTDGDMYPDGADPVPLHFNYENGDLAPWGNPDTAINVADLLICLQFVLDLKQPENGDLARGDLYPQGAPDGEIGLPDCILLQRLVLFP